MRLEFFSLQSSQMSESTQKPAIFVSEKKNHTGTRYHKAHFMAEFIMKRKLLWLIFLHSQSADLDTATKWKRKVFSKASRKSLCWMKKVKILKIGLATAWILWQTFSRQNAWTSIMSSVFSAFPQFQPKHDRSTYFLTNQKADQPMYVSWGITRQNIINSTG